MTIALGYVHPGWVPHEFLVSLERVRPVIGGVVRMEAAGGMIASARNEVVNAFLEMDEDVTHLWWVDSDMVFGQETLERLLSAKLPIISALYYGLHKETGETFPVANTKKGKLSREDLEAWPDNLVSVFGTGMGCCLVRRDVYKKLGVRKFWPYSEETLYGMYCDQDVVFCNRAASAGFPVYIQRDNVVGHVKTGIVWG